MEIKIKEENWEKERERKRIERLERMIEKGNSEKKWKKVLRG